MDVSGLKEGQEEAVERVLSEKDLFIYWGSIKESDNLYNGQDLIQLPFVAVIFELHNTIRTNGMLHIATFHIPGCIDNLLSAF